LLEILEEEIVVEAADYLVAIFVPINVTIGLYMK